MATQTGEGKLPIVTITALQDADREELAKQPGRIVLYRGDSVIYVADLHENAAAFGITQDILIARFHLIRADLNTQED